MLELEDISFFSKLSAKEINALKNYIEIKDYPKESTILAESEDCISLLILVQGKLIAKLSAKAHASQSELILQEGSVLSELALIANINIPAHIKAAEDSRLLSISHESFQKILEEEPELHEFLIRIITTRLQYKSPLELTNFNSFVSVFVFQENNEDLRAHVKQIPEGIRQACSKTKFINDKDSDLESIDKEIQSWKECGPIGHPLVVSLNSSNLAKLAALFNEHDRIVFIDCYENYQVFKTSYKKPKTFFLSINEQSGVAEHCYKFKSQQDICRMVRLAIKKEIGLALGSGAARGFTHLGVLQILEDENIPIDFISGTSIGGIVAITYSLTHSAYKTTELIKEAIGAKRKVQDISFFPRQSLLRGDKIRRTAERVFSDKTFTDLTIPVEVVSSDLGQATRHIINSGLLRDAALATSAIPGIFPPLIKDGKVLVDGALTSKVPVGLLRKRKCSLQIAVNATTAKGLFSCDPQSKACLVGDIDSALYDLQNIFELTKGINLGSIINYSWDLLAWSESSMEAAKADIAINPNTSAYSSFAFDDFDSLVELGKVAARDKIKAIKVATRKILEPDSYHF